MSLTNTFYKRQNLTNLISLNLKKIIDDPDVEIIKFGIEEMVNNETLSDYIKSHEINNSYDGMLLKFAPDFILIKKSHPMEIYFLEVKHTVTPLWASKNMSVIEARHENIKLCDVGLMAREAWSAYNMIYPNTILLCACSYNPKLLMVQFVKDIKCLRCHKDADPAGYDCTQCPLKCNKFFEYSRNTNSQGSQTPQTNISYNNFEDLQPFFEKLNISVNAAEIDAFKSLIKSEGVSLPTYLNNTLRINIINRLKDEGCYWL